MIGKIRGIVVEKRTPWVMIELSNGLSYELEAPMSTFYHLPELGKSVALYTHLTVREDAHLLYGFLELRERSLFRLLIRVNGVGPKLALTILSSFDPQAFIACINHGDTGSLTRVPGIGKKTAERLVIEMRDRLSDPFALDMGNEPVFSVGSNPSVISPFSSSVQEALSALVALGYKPQEASKAIAQIDASDLSCEKIIRQVLQKSLA
ncbi:MAG: Holliday junction branch migration protein RuvA [Gammaproteobacteria bacterium]|nr:Holliday junction branch migration protein RuvA [Gammaproteobacteria bacterium]MCD8542968.1 Holliday junction branch migration protein RuvA [Gammaproteobacteria bacterium]